MAREIEVTARRLLGERYGISAQAVELMARHSFNSVVKVTTGDSTFAMRLGVGSRIHPDETEHVEALWLELLAEGDAEIQAPVPVIATDGSAVQRFRHGNRTCVCSVFRWVDGAPMTSADALNRARELGELLARLHRNTAIDPPDRLCAAVRFDRAVYLPPNDVLDSAANLDRNVVVEGRARVQEVLDSLWRAPPRTPQLIHGDFGPHNVIQGQAGLVPIDFQDLRFGFVVQDLAITIADLARKHPRAIPGFIAGYETTLDWPRHDRETWQMLVASRSLNLINLALHLRTPQWMSVVPSHIGIIERCLEGSWVGLPASHMRQSPPFPNETAPS